MPRKIKKKIKAKKAHKKGRVRLRALWKKHRRRTKRRCY